MHLRIGAPRAGIQSISRDFADVCRPAILQRRASAESHEALSIFSSAGSSTGRKRRRDAVLIRREAGQRSIGLRNQ
jgi:hypothetical protein